MSIIERIKSWFSKLAIWRSRPDGDATETKPETKAEKPVSDGTSEVATPPNPVEEQPPVSYLDVGMMYGLEGPEAFKRPRVEMWPLQPSETFVRIEAADGRVWNAGAIGGYERKQNPQVNATNFMLRGSAAATPSYAATMPDPVTVVVVNTRVGTIKFGGVDPMVQQGFYQKVQIK